MISKISAASALFSTTRDFLDDLNLRSLDELPPLEELGTLVEGTDGQPEEAADGKVKERTEGVEADVTEGVAEATATESEIAVATDEAALPVETTGDDAKPIEAQV